MLYDQGDQWKGVEYSDFSIAWLQICELSPRLSGTKLGTSDLNLYTNMILILIYVNRENVKSTTSFTVPESFIP